jgi:predicted transcriptional regulator of viral defense system
MYNLLKPLSVREELLQRNIRIFTSREFSLLLQLNLYQTKYALAELVKEGLLVRLKRGVYALKTDPPNEKEIANALYRPSYISFDYALAYHGLIPGSIRSF